MELSLCRGGSHMLPQAVQAPYNHQHPHPAWHRGQVLTQKVGADVTSVPLLYCACSIAQSHLTLCHFMDYSLLGSSVHGIFQARIPKWVAISFSRGLPDPGIEPESLAFPALAVEVCVIYI